MNQDYVSVAIIYNSQDGLILLQLRDMNAVYGPGKWGFFGGHSEKNEKPEETLVREILEETGVQITSSNARRLFDYNIDYNLHRFVFLIEDFSKEITLNEGQKFEWISVNKVLEYDLTDTARADIQKFLSLI